MLYTVSLARLSLVRLKIGSQRTTIKQQVLGADLKEIRQAVLFALGHDT